MNELVDMLVARKVKAVFVESSVPKESIESLLLGAQNRGHNVTIAAELYSDAMGDAGTYEGTYIGMMDHNLSSIARALGSETVPEKGFGNRRIHSRLSLRESSGGYWRYFRGAKGDDLTTQDS